MRREDLVTNKHHKHTHTHNDHLHRHPKVILNRQNYSHNK